MPNKRKKRGKKSKRSGEERKQKVKVEGTGKLSKKKTQNFAFCTCPNFEICNLALGMKASLVLNL